LIVLAAYLPPKPLRAKTEGQIYVLVKRLSENAPRKTSP